MGGRFVFAFLVLAALLGCPAGGAWIARESGTTQDINAVSFVTDALGFAAANGGVALRTNNGGGSFEVISPMAENINDVFFVSSTEVYFLGASGTLKKTTDQGATFTDEAFSGVGTAPNYRKGSAWGNYRAFAIYDAPGSNSYILASDDKGNWTKSTIADFEIYGVLLATSESGAPTLWAWGRWLPAGDYVILKGSSLSEVYSNSSKAVKDIFFVTQSDGFAVGSGGLALRTSTGGGGVGGWDAISVGSSNDLNSLFFITPLFGWVVGKAGTIAFTRDGGTSWTAYSVDSSVDINDIYVRLVSISGSAGAAGVRTSAAASAATYATVYSFVAGTGGKIFQLSSPNITSVSPHTRAQGWLGTIEVTGTGFMPGASISFSSMEGIVVLYTSFESESRLWAPVAISTAEAPTGLQDLLVANPDATFSREANAFAILPFVAGVTFGQIWFDGNKYLPPRYDPTTAATWEFTINRNPFVSFEVNSTFGMTAAAANVQMLTAYQDAAGNNQYILSALPASAVTKVSDNKVQVSGIITDDLPEGTQVTLTLYAEDSAANAGLETLSVWTAKAGVPPVGTSPPKGAQGEEYAYFVPSKNTWGLASPLAAVIQLQPGFDTGDITLIIADFKGTQIYKKRMVKGAGAFNARALSTPRGFVTKISLTIDPADIPAGLAAGNGIYLVLVINNETGKIIAKSPLVVRRQ